MISGISAIFLMVLIFIGAVYISVYEQAPLWERIQVFGVGFGIYCGLILLCIS